MPARKFGGKATFEARITEKWMITVVGYPSGAQFSNVAMAVEITKDTLLSR